MEARSGMRNFLGVRTGWERSEMDITRQLGWGLEVVHDGRAQGMKTNTRFTVDIADGG